MHRHPQKEHLQCHYKFVEYSSLAVSLSVFSLSRTCSRSQHQSQRLERRGLWMQDYTPLMHACKNNNLKLSKLLVSFGADAKAENEEVSKHAACQCTSVMAALLLCRACIPACPFSHGSCNRLPSICLCLPYCTVLLMCMQFMFVQSQIWLAAHGCSL